MRPTLKLSRWLFLSAFVMGAAALVAWGRRAIFAQETVAVPIPQPREYRPAAQAQPSLRRIPFSFTWVLFTVILTLLTWKLVNSPEPRLATTLVIIVAILINRPRILAAAAIGLMIEAALTFPTTSELWELDIPTMRMLLAGATLWMSMHLEWNTARIPLLPGLDNTAYSHIHLSRIHLGIFLLGVAALAALIRINAVSHLETQAVSASIDVQYALLVAGFILVVAGLGHLRLPRRLPAIPWSTVLLVGGLIGLALAVRFWELGERNRFFIDELFFADNIRLLREWRSLSLTAPFDGVAAEPLLYPYWQSLTVNLFGRNFVGLRGASAIIGALTIGGIYLLGRTLFDRKTALLAALLLATFPPHVHFSRIGLSEIAMTLFGTLALAFLARGVMHKRQADFALGGALLGMTHYFHEGGKYLYTPLAIAWLGGLWLLNRRQVSARHLLVAGLACLLLALPIYTTLIATQKPLAARMVANDAGLPGEYWRQLFNGGDWMRHVYDHILPPFLVYIQRWDISLFYGGQTPLVLGFLAPGLLLGAFYVLRCWNSPGTLLLILWVLATSMGNSLLVNSGGAARYVVVFPGLTLLAAAGIRYALPLIWPDEPNANLPPGLRSLYDRARSLSPYIQPRVLLLAVAGLGIAIAQADYYFNKHLVVYNEQTRESWGFRDAHDAVLRSVNFPQGTTIHIITRTDPPDFNFMRGVLYFMVDGLELNIMKTENFTPAYLAGLNRDADHAFYIGPYNTEALNMLRPHFVLQPPQVSPYDLPAEEQFVLYYASSSDQDAQDDVGIPSSP